MNYLTRRMLIMWAFQRIKMGVQKMFGFITLIFATVFAHMFGAKKASAGTLPVPPPIPKPLPPAPNTISYNPESWRPFIRALLPKGISEQFVMNWLAKESDGNPCGIGAPGATGPDGHPLEQGIGQFYNPDDMKLLGIPSGAFRQYCVPGTSRCSRPLTQKEMADQARAMINKARRSVQSATNILILNGANRVPGWSPALEDFWKLVKLVHGLPGLANGMIVVTHKLGRPPSGWSEFKTQTGQVKFDSGTEAKRSKFAKVFANAEETAAGAGVAVV